MLSGKATARGHPRSRMRSAAGLNRPAMTSQTHEARRPLAGILYSAAAFLIWGLSPAYWKAMQAVPAIEIVSTAWCGRSCSWRSSRWSSTGGAEFVSALRSPRTLLILSVTTCW